MVVPWRTFIHLMSIVRVCKYAQRRWVLPLTESNEVWVLWGVFRAFKFKFIRTRLTSTSHQFRKCLHFWIKMLLGFIYIVWWRVKCNKTINTINAWFTKLEVKGVKAIKLIKLRDPINLLVKPFRIIGLIIFIKTILFYFFKKILNVNLVWFERS
jgi:hypothetical protein